MNDGPGAPVGRLSAWCALCLAVAACVARGQTDYATPYKFTTLVNIDAGATSVDGLGAPSPSAVAVDGEGNLYIACSYAGVVRKVTPSGSPGPLAGTYSMAGSADGPGATALFNIPTGIAVDASGNVYVTDRGNHTIRKITPEGVVSTLAGMAGISGNADGTGSAARFHNPFGIAVDASGTLYVGDSGNRTIRKITPAGVVTTLAGSGAPGYQDGTGAGATFAQPEGVALDVSGNLFVADSVNSMIRKVTPTGVVTTLAGFLAESGSADGTGSAARFYLPGGVAVDGSGNLFVADTYNDTIREVSPTGVVTTLAGSPGVESLQDGGSGPTALFNMPLGIAVDASGNLYVADTGNSKLKKGHLDGTPTIQAQPADALVAAGSGATFSVTASGTTPLSYQWYYAGVAIPGATGASYAVANSQTADAGSYSVTITDGDGSVTSGVATLSVRSGNPTARLVNLSTRAQVGTGGALLIAGFAITGTGSEPLLVRGIGPGLTQFGVGGALAHPSLALLDSSGNLLASNTGWGTGANPAQVASVSAKVGAFPLAAGSADCALLIRLPAGNYTVQVSGVGATTGAGLAEVYEASPGGARLSNLSTRAQAGSGADSIIAGFVVSGSGTEQLLVRGVGPGLAQFGVPGFLAQSSLEVFGASGDVIASNSGWGTGSDAAQIPSVENFVGAFALPPGSADSAQIVNLPPGAYTAQVSGVNGSSGVGLAEIYEVP